MKWLFWSATNFNQDLSSWDVSSVVNMNRMFEKATSFNQNLSSWDVSSVTNMIDMFLDADALSDANKCVIHVSFSSNANWPYDWSENCTAAGYTSGCTDPYAANYDSTAYFNDGSCVYPDNGEFSLNFDGVNDYVGIDTSLLNNVSQFTMAGWLKSDTGGYRKGFFGQNNLIEFGYQNDTTMWGWTASGGDVYWSIDSTFSFNSKHHAVLVGTGSSLMIYIDGELKSTDGSTTASYNLSLIHI